MPNPTSHSSRYASLRATRRVLARMATVARVGLAMAGVGLFLEWVGPLVADVQLTYGERVVTGIVALVVLGGFGLASWLVGNLLWAAAEVVDVLVDQAEAAGHTADLVEKQVAPTLARAAVALERLAAVPERAPQEDGRTLAVEGVRRAIEARRWARAERLIEALRRDYPNAPEAVTLSDELAQTRQATVDELTALLNEARRDGDADRVIALRDALTEHLQGEPLDDLDRKVVGWLARVIRDRTRDEAVEPDTVALVVRVVETFGDSPEVSRLQGTLPRLRRRAGLCAHCGQPYAGPRAVCPRCRTRGSAAASNVPEPEVGS